MRERLGGDRFGSSGIVAGLAEAAARLSVDDPADLLDERGAVQKVAHPHADAGGLRFVGGSDPPLRRADLRGIARGGLAHRIDSARRGRMTWARSLMNNRRSSVMPPAMRLSISAINFARSRTVPLPMTIRASGRNTPEGMCCRAWRRPPIVTVCPALGPPW
jgi:hypothetical protein